MLSIHPEVKDFGNEIKKENMRKLLIFIADQISENTTSRPGASFVKRS